jgi:hypothetical protein
VTTNLQLAAKLRVISNYKEDEANTLSKTVLMMRIGGGKSGGIHGAHFGPGVRIRYAAADAKRQTIPWIEKNLSRYRPNAYVV